MFTLYNKFKTYYKSQIVNKNNETKNKIILCTPKQRRKQYLKIVKAYLNNYVVMLI